jgi:hypothetical protein
LADEAVYLVPIGSGRFELYTEPADDPPGGSPPREPAGFWARTLRRLHQRWHETARAAQTERGTGPPAGRLARVRDWLVRRIAESIAEQRTLWSLRQCTMATLVHPSDLNDTQADEIRVALLSRARAYHGRWLAIDALLFVASGVFFFVPGPNVLAYYFLFRVVGHYLSWRGARQGLEAMTWSYRPEPALAELGRLAALPRDARHSRVEAIACALNLPRLAAFFERTAVPVR